MLYAVQYSKRLATLIFALRILRPILNGREYKAILAICSTQKLKSFPYKRSSTFVSIEVSYRDPGLSTN